MFDRRLPSSATTCSEAAGPEALAATSPEAAVTASSETSANPGDAARVNAMEAVGTFVAEMASIVAAEAIRAIRIIEEAVITPVAIIVRTIIVIIKTIIDSGRGAGVYGDGVAVIHTAGNQHNYRCCTDRCEEFAHTIHPCFKRQPDGGFRGSRLPLVAVGLIASSQ
jgi:hypothetical protein